MLPGCWIDERLATGWQPDDPLLPVGLTTLARQAASTSSAAGGWTSSVIPLEEAVAAVGVQEMFARDGTLVDRADSQGQVPWSPPLHQLQAVALTGVVKDRSGDRDRRGLRNAGQ